jgi:hypothetical protein
MTVTINAVTSTGLVQTSDGSGIIKVQSAGVTTNALAWVNFNGTGTVAIRSSYNVSSITDNGTGDYTLNFTSALTDTNYVLSGMIGGTSGAYLIRDYSDATSRTTFAARIFCVNTSFTAVDPAQVNVSVFGN